MAKRIAVAGYGAAGRALAERLSALGDNVRIVQTQAPPALLPTDIEFVRADLEDADEAQAAFANVDTVVCAVGIPYISEIYVRVWPIVMRNLLDACAKSARALRLRRQPLHVRTAVASARPGTCRSPPMARSLAFARKSLAFGKRLMSGALCAQRRCARPIFTDPRRQRPSCRLGVARLLADKAALALYRPDQPHDFTYVPDFARAPSPILGNFLF